jgi:uncharacterized protein YndB with AHSA1/START domain
MSSDKRSLTLVYSIKAPTAKVYAALTDPEKIVRWWGPDGGPTVSAEAEVRPGGHFRVVFRTEDAKEYTNHGVYQEVVKDEKLVFTWHHPEAPERDSLVTVLLKAVEGGTELTLIHEGFPDEETRDSHRDGWKGALNKLQAFVA